MKTNISFFNNKQKIIRSQKTSFWLKNIINNFFAVAFLSGLFCLLSFIPISENQNIWMILKKNQWFFYSVIVFFILLALVLTFFYNFFAFFLTFFLLLFFLFSYLTIYFFENKNTNTFLISLILFSFLLFSLFSQIKIIHHFLTYFDRKIITHKLIKKDFDNFKSLFKPYFIIFLLSIVFYFAPLFLFFIQKITKGEIISDLLQKWFPIFHSFSEIGRFMIIFVLISFFWNILFFIFFCYLLIFVTKEKNHLFYLIKKINTKVLLFFPSNKKISQEISFFKMNVRKFVAPWFLLLKAILYPFLFLWQKINTKVSSFSLFNKKITQEFSFLKITNKKFFYPWFLLLKAILFPFLFLWQKIKLKKSLLKKQRKNLFKINDFYQLRFFWLIGGSISFLIFLFLFYPLINTNNQELNFVDHFLKGWWNKTNLFLLVIFFVSIFVFLFFNLESGLTSFFFLSLRYLFFIMVLFLFFQASFVQKKEINYFISFFLFLLVHQTISNLFFYQQYKKEISWNHQNLTLINLIPLFLIPLLIFPNKENQDILLGMKLLISVIFYQIIINYHFLKWEQQILKWLRYHFLHYQKNWKIKLIAIKPKKNNQEEIVKNVNDWL